MIFDELTLIDDVEPHRAAFNMAMDEVLLRSATAPLLRVYRWACPAVSFGYFGLLAEALRSAPEREPIRRWTGGGIVLHGDDLTYTIIVPRSQRFCAEELRESYRIIHDVIATVLRESGARVQLSTGAGVKASNSCFENAVEHDIVADGVKVAGAAQRRTRWGLLHQGSVQNCVGETRFATNLARRLSARTAARELTGDELAAATELARSKYGTDDWLGRR
ncbi:MAG TPA: hypothetical protein VGO90_10760 [Chthoniobacteraceae bacterium]|nr:lipoate-protein ligase [Chthoniobacter sp.]HEV7868154.1 hypothetical protein [Chthoniobacteraceae bacterium]